VPTQWYPDNFTYPPPFAPTLEGTGAITTRQAPGFSTPGAGDYWAYDNLWWLDGDVQISADWLGRNVTAYYRGLVSAYASPAPDLTKIEATFAPLPGQGSVALFSGTINTFDPFFTAPAAPLQLRAVAASVYCRSAAHRAIILLLAPVGYEQAIWSTLVDEAVRFRCGG
jgi:hypothetical protein